MVMKSDRGMKMKRKNIVILSVIIAIVLLIPIPSYFKDGGTVEYNAVLYGVTKRHSIHSNGYDIGTEIRILWFEVYNDVEFIEN